MRQSGVKHLSTRVKGVIAWGALLAVLLVVVITVAVRRDGGATESSGRPTTGEMPGMKGMTAANTTSNGSVHLTAAQVRQFGVTFGTVEQRTLTDEVRTVGIVTLDETKMARVSPKFGGYIERLYVNITGQPVRRGQPLLEIYSPELVAAQQELLLAAGLDESLGASAVPGVPAGSSNLLDAAKRRLRLWDISEGQIDEVLRTGKVQRTLTLYAPVSGVVIEKNVLQGQAIQAGENLYTISDLSDVWVEAQFREADAGKVRGGSAATVELSAFPGRPIPGRVQYVYPTLQEQARTFKARIVVPNPDGRIKPGMYATVRFSTLARTALTVPTSAVVNTGERKMVFMDMGGGELMPMDVETGRVAGEYTEILSGVDPGQRVVTSAQFLLDSESNLGEVMKSMIGMGGSADMGAMDMSGESQPEAGGMTGTEMKGADMKGMKMPAAEE